jgi:hypothetical protein
MTLDLKNPKVISEHTPIRDEFGSNNNLLPIIISSIAFLILLTFNLLFGIF